MDNPSGADSTKKLPPSPEEKLLRSPTFWEKYGKYFWLILTLLLVIVSGCIYIATNYITKSQQVPHLPVPTQLMSPSSPIPTENLYREATGSATAESWLTDSTKDFSFKHDPTSSVVQKSYSEIVLKRKVIWGSVDFMTIRFTTISIFNSCCRRQ